MKRMPNLKITKEEYQNLQRNFTNRGAEGLICFSGKENTIYKIFQSNNQDIPVSFNKQQKIIELYQKDLDYTVKPISTISCAGEMIGYEMTYNPFDQALESLPSLPRKDLIKILKKVKIALLYLQSKDITYGDVTDSNILVNTKNGTITFCDIDNMRVGSHPIDVKGYALSRYYEQVGLIDAKADAYMHNLLTIKTLSGRDLYESEIIKDLRKGIYPTKYKNTAKPIFASMTVPESFSGEYLIDHIKR